MIARPITDLDLFAALSLDNWCRGDDACAPVPELPEALRRKIESLKRPEAPALEQFRLVALYARDWMEARLAPEIVPEFAYRSAATEKRTVPVVAGDVRIVALDTEGERLPSHRGTLYREDGPRAGAVSEVVTNPEGVYMLGQLEIGRYLLVAKEGYIEFEVVAEPDFLP